MEALQLAVHYYEEPDMIAIIGADQAAAKRQQFLQLLLNMTGD